MTHDWYGRPLVRVEPALWTWRGQAVDEPDALRQAQGTNWAAQGTNWAAQSPHWELALRQAQGANWEAQGTDWGAQDASPVRIGDAERDQAVSALGDHFAAGRLTREEFDERSDQAMRARFSSDLAPLFADLPRAPRANVIQQPGRRGPYPMIMPLFWLAPLLLLVGVVAAVVLSAPWIIWTFFWIFLFTGFWGRRRFSQHLRR